MATGSGFFVELDDVLLGRARRGDVDALEAIYRTYSKAVYTLARRLCGSPEDGEEVLQETFLQVVRKIGSYRGQGAFGAWLRKVTVSRALMHLRRAHVRRVEWDTEDPEQVETHPVIKTGSRLEARIDVERALERLSDTARIVVWLHDVEGLTHAEIARLLDRSESYSKSQLSRAYGRLRLWTKNQESGCHASNDRRAVGAAGR
jgi:RNA polymerase sigma factor (sigma-70 family)